MLYFIMQASSEDMSYYKDKEDHFQLDDDSFLTQLEEALLSPKLFDHEAHLRMAWLYLRKYGLQNAIAQACSTIQKFDQIHGSGSKFHLTLTVASVKVVHHFMQKSNTSDFQDFMHEFPVLRTDFFRLLLQHYGQDVLQSKLAKTSYVKPDLLPF